LTLYGNYSGRYGNCSDTGIIQADWGIVQIWELYLVLAEIVWMQELL